MDLNQEQQLQQQRRKRLIIIAAVALACLAVIFEISARVWLATSKKVAGGSPALTVLHYYPELKELFDARINTKNGRFDVLLLGDSALCEEYGKPAETLQKELEAQGYAKVKVWNLSRPADTSRDSLVKYRWLDGKKFDWVIVYQGIGDLRLNNVPEKEFDNKYAHVGWYNEIGEMVDKPKSFPKNKLAAPLLWDYFKMKGPKGGNRPTLSAASVLDKQTLDYGASLQSAEAFRRNLKGIVDVSKDRREFLTLATFATYLDPKYTKEAFDQDLKTRNAGTSGSLQLAYASAPYGGKALPCEVWGTPKTIEAGVRAQNEQTSQVARKRIDFADLATSVSAHGENFIDVCHFSPAGVKLWAQLLANRAPKKPAAATAGTTSTATAVKAAGTTATATKSPVSSEATNDNSDAAKIKP